MSAEICIDSVGYEAFNQFRNESKVRNRAVILKMSGSSEAFFNKGLTMARLSEDGIEAFCKDRLTILVRLGRKTGRHSLRSQVGTGSNSQLEDGEAITIRFISSSVAGENSWSDAPW